MGRWGKPLIAVRLLHSARAPQQGSITSIAAPNLAVGSTFPCSFEPRKSQAEIDQTNHQPEGGSDTPNDSLLCRYILSLFVAIAAKPKSGVQLAPIALLGSGMPGCVTATPESIRGGMPGAAVGFQVVSPGAIRTRALAAASVGTARDRTDFGT